MTHFKPGWYEVQVDSTRRSYCKHFITESSITATCYVESNGKQILTWHAGIGNTETSRADRWNASFRFLSNAPAGDGWDNPRSAQPTPIQTPGSFSRASRQPTSRELAARASTANLGASSGLACEKEIHVGLFFDGTNNNRVRDKPKRSQSNIVTLYESHKDDSDGFFAFYIPGVGTKFPEIGENSESSNGKTFAAGGEARIHYGMLQVFNAVSLSAGKGALFTPDEMKKLSTSVVGGLSTLWRGGDVKMLNMFAGFEASLKEKIKNARPKICKVNVSVFGFSRGAAEARTFCNWLQKVCNGQIGGAAFEIRFLGIFDTVASVLLADSSPVGGSGFMDWADHTMEIAGIPKIVHYVAANEIRRSFPLSTARNGGVWPTGTKEFAYPGAHSNVGGGYGPGDQGKSRNGRSALLSQIPLNDMYFEALNAGVALFAKNELPAAVRGEFAVDADLDRLFGEYAKWTSEVDEKQDIAKGGARPEDRLEYHMQRYWRWRASVVTDAQFKSLESYKNASEQDKTDLWEAEMDWRWDLAKARVAVDRQKRSRSRGSLRGDAKLHQDVVDQVALANTVTAPVSQFYDRYVHDSHAGFWLLGPITEADRKEFIAEIKDKKKAYDRFTALSESTTDPESSAMLALQAASYELNGFEKRVLQSDAKSPGTVPLMTDRDAADLRGNAGNFTSVTLWAMGTATRREAGGHARYRAIFDKS